VEAVGGTWAVELPRIVLGSMSIKGICNSALIDANVQTMRVRMRIRDEYALLEFC
jgi:hypothetical protein